MSQPKCTVKLQCTFAGCYFTAEGSGPSNEAARNKANGKLIRHKLRDDDHDYCKVCDLDFECFDDLVKHKAGSNDSVHISCPWCGRDFQSHSGRNAHIAQSHPKEQNIECFGCGEVFGQTAAFIFHLEQGHCSAISSGEFMGHVRHKHFTYKALEAPGSAVKWNVKDLQDEAAADMDDGGGVILDLGGDPGASGLQNPLQPQRAEFKVGPNVVDPYPPLGPSQGRQRLAAVSLGEDAESRNDAALRLEPTPAEAAAGRMTPNAWSAGVRLPESIRPAAVSANKSAVKQDVDWDARFALKDASDNKCNMMSDISIANPDHPTFTADRFYNHITESYECPWADCEKAFTAVVDLEMHLRDDHEARDPRCPVCQKLFKSLHALIAHCEAINSRCRVKHSKDYGAFIHRITGGFVNATVKERDDVKVKQTFRAIDGSERTEDVGISYIEYAGQAPEGVQSSEDMGRRLTQVTGVQTGWVPPHRRAGLLGESSFQSVRPW